MNNWQQIFQSVYDWGFGIIDRVIDPDRIQALVQAVDAARNASDRRDRDGRLYAVRNLQSLPAVRSLADSPDVRNWIEPILGANARLVRGLLFDKTQGGNWRVSWHQDRSISVAQQLDTPGYGPWSLKAGVIHVQPPVEVLQSMLTIRISLDRCDLENGPLRVLPGTHAYGLLSDEEIASMRADIEPFPCTAPAGGAVLMRPLLLHSSQVARTSRHRRVVHLEFAGIDLPGGLEWLER